MTIVRDELPPASPRDAATPGFRAWAVVGLLAVVGCLNYLDRNMITTMRSSIVAAIPMSDAEFGLLTSVFLWVYGFLSPLAGFLADRFGRSRVIIGSLLVWSLFTWLTAHVTTLPMLLAVRALMGISEACYIPAAFALIADYHRGPTRSFATGVHLTGVMAGQALGGVGGWLAERHAWNYPFSFFGVSGIAYAGVLLLVLRDPPHERATTSGVAGGAVRFTAALRHLMANRPFLIAFAFFGLLGVVGWGLVGWLPTYFQERFHLSQSVAGFSATGYLQAGAFVGVLLGGFLADRWSRFNPRARILVPAFGLCFAALGILTLSLTSVFAVAIAGIVLYGTTRMFTDANMMPILCLIADPRYRATGYGLLNMLSCVIGGVGVYVGGRLRDAHVHMTTMFLFAFGCTCVCATLLFLLRPPARAVAPAPID